MSISCITISNVLVKGLSTNFILHFYGALHALLSQNETMLSLCNTRKIISVKQNEIIGTIKHTFILEPIHEKKRKKNIINSTTVIYIILYR